MKSATRSLVAALAVAAAAGVARGQTVTVTISADRIDIDPQHATIDDLPGPDGDVSFSEAMIATNNTPGHQTVGFAIPRSDWSLQFLFPGRAVLLTNTGYYFRAFDTVTIDGTTQTEYTGDTNPDGHEVVIYGAELYLNGDDDTLIGFDSTAVTVTGANGLVEGNTGGMNITLYSGGGSVVRGNTGGTIKIDRSSDNVIVGNTVQRVRVLGGGPPAVNNRVGGPGDADRNFLTGYGTWNSEGLPAGTTVQIFGSIGTVVENNRIGTTPDGLAKGNPAATIGVGFEGENTDAVIRGNLIAGILGEGRGPHHHGRLYGRAIRITGSGRGIDVIGNTIGLDINGEPRLGSVYGIDIDSTVPADIVIGGAAPGDGNVIAGHRFNGITVGRLGEPMARISGNSIHSNDALGIDLVPSRSGYGVTPNDPLDADTGANGLQNFPVIAAAVRRGDTVRIAGTLHSSPGDDFTIEAFASPACDPSGHGEGAVYLGAVAVSTDDAGDAAFDATFAATLPAGWIATATATLEPIGATSELSACAPIGDDADPADVNGDGVVDFADLLAVLAAWGPCPPPPGACPADVDGNGEVGFADVLVVLANWS